MLHPSYQDLLESVSETAQPGEEDIVESRYSIVIAAAKRTRELVDGAEPLVEGMNGRKALSTAVEEIYEKKVRIVESTLDTDGDEAKNDIENDADQETIVNTFEDEVEEEAGVADYEENGDYFENLEDEEEITEDFDDID